MIKQFSKKTIAAIVAGTFLLAVAALPFAAQAASQEKQDRPAMHQRQVNPDKVAERMAQHFGVSKEAILKYQAQGYSFRDLGRAAFLAKASGKSFESVITLKTSDKNWKAVAKEIGVTQEQIKATHREMAAERVTAKTGMAKEEVTGLLDQGYKARDIAMAGILSKKSSRSASDIIQLKKINNTWMDVAAAIGVDKNELKSELKTMYKGHHGKMMRK